MDIIFDFDKLKSLLANFYELSGVRYSLIDMENDILCASNDISPFCSIINSIPNGHERCRACDSKAMREATATTNAAHIYTCHAGLVEACIPLVINGETIAFVFLGQALAEGDILPQWEATKQSLSWYDEPDELKSVFLSQKQLPRRVIHACAQLLRACTSYIWLDGVIKSGTLTEMQRLYAYINENYAQKLTLDKISEDLATGKTKLCSIASKQNTSISQMITKKRVSVAKSYLENTDLYISEISGLVGISDYNYFTKLFKHETGLTPKEYRRLHMNN